MCLEIDPPPVFTSLGRPLPLPSPPPPPRSWRKRRRPLAPMPCLGASRMNDELLRCRLFGLTEHTYGHAGWTDADQTEQRTDTGRTLGTLRAGGSAHHRGGIGWLRGVGLRFETPA